MKRWALEWLSYSRGVQEKEKKEKKRKEEAAAVLSQVSSLLEIQIIKLAEYKIHDLVILHIFTLVIIFP